MTFLFFLYRRTVAAALLMIYLLAAAPLWLKHGHPEGKPTIGEDAVSLQAGKDILHAASAKISSPCKACNHHPAACEPAEELTAERSSFPFSPRRTGWRQPDLHCRFMQTCLNKGPPAAQH